MVPEAKEMDLEAYSYWALEKRNQPNYINGQTKFLSPKGGITTISEKLGNGNLMLFPLSKLNESIETLHKKFPDDFGNLHYQNVNISKKDQEISDSLRTFISKYMSDDNILLELANLTELLSVEEKYPSEKKGQLSFPRMLIGKTFNRLGNYRLSFGSAMLKSNEY